MSGYSSLKLTALLLCEQTLFDRGHFTLVNEFREVWADKVPFALPAFSIFGLITDEVGVCPRIIEIRLADSERFLETTETLYLMQAEAPLNRSVISNVYRAAIRVNSVTLPRFGRYDFHVVVDGEVIDLVSLFVLPGGFGHAEKN